MHSRKNYFNIAIIITFFLTIVIHFEPASIRNATAQEDNRLRIGQSIGGNVDDIQFRSLYIFSGESGQTVSLAMTTTEGDLDPYLLLLDNNNQVLRLSDDDGASNNAVISSYTLPYTGDYFVIATRFGHDHGLTEGRYRLTLNDIGGRTGNVITTGEVINIDNPVTGRLNNEVPEIIYRFEALRGQVINIDLRRTSGDLDPLVDLFDAAGQPLVTGDDNQEASDSLNASIENYLVPADGVYFIRATRYGRETGNSFGSFLLSVSEIPVEELGTSSENARLLSYGDNVEATIDEDVIERYFVFEGLRGDVISVIIEREIGNIAPRVFLYDDEFRPLSISPDAAAVTQARIPGASLPYDGTYYISVGRYRGEDGTSVGTFSLQLNGRPGIGGTDYLEIIYGVQLSGIIDDEKIVEEYLFVGEAGDVVTISMQRVDGNLDTLLTLKDSTGKTLDFNDDESDNSQDSLIRRFELPTDGIYIIEASRYGRNDGFTSGIYGLSLDLNN